jgi:hypothetical protein
MNNLFSSQYIFQRSLDGDCGSYLATGITYTSTCGNQNLPGIDRFWLASMDCISAVTYNVNNVITAVTMSGTAKMFRFLPAPYSASVAEPGTVDISKLLSYASPSLSVALGRKQTVTRNVVQDMRSKKLGGILKDNNGIYWGFALDAVDSGVSAGRGADVTAFDAPSGKAKTDDAGYTLTISYDSPYLMREVSAAAVAAVVDRL